MTVTTAVNRWDRNLNKLHLKVNRRMMMIVHSFVTVRSLTKGHP